jgi:uncharacterized protein (DUF2147 family)
MKKVFIVLFISAGALTAFGQKLNADKVPAAAKAAFSKAHPGITGTWEKEKGNYEIEFKDAGKKMSCVIDKSGNIIETETDIAVTELPATVLTYMKEHYKGAKIKEAARIVKGNGEINFEAEVNGKDVVFDANGKFIKEEKD